MTPGLDARIHFEAFAERATLAATLAERIAAKLEQDMIRSGRASLAVSGGTTPARLLAALSAQAIRWEHVDITLVDERWVPESSARSNMAMVRAQLSRGHARAARLVPLFTDDATPADALDHVEGLLAQLALPLSVAVLGMGEDGHTASYFSQGDRLVEAIDPMARRRIISINAPAAGEPRITLTLPMLLSAAKLILHIEGEAKRRVFNHALEPGAVEDLPIRAVLHHARHLEVVWAP